MFISIIIYIFVVSKLKKSIKKSNVMNANEVLDTCGLNWTVSKEQLITKGGIEIPDKVALIKSSDNSVLGVLGTSYQEFQNEEMAELLFQISKSTGLTFHKGGEFNGGQQVYLQLKSDDFKLGDDRIEGYITACSSHNGSTSLAFGNSTLTISCLNTFYKSFKNLDNKLKHTISMKPRLEVILRGVDALLEEEKNDFKIIERLSNTKLTPEINDLVLSKVFNLTKQELSVRKSLSTRTQNAMIRFQSDWDKEMAQKGSNLWSAMSSATRYSTHSQYKTPEKAMFNKMMGKTGDNERMLWRELSAMV